MGRTKKIGRAGRFGARYGTKEKHTTAAIESEEKKKHQCPVCKKMKLKRIAAGIWECRGCHAKIAGGAYVPKKEKFVESVGEKNDLQVSEMREGS